MFTGITVTTSSDSQGNQFVSIRRYDNGRKHTGMGRMYRTGKVERVYTAIRSLGFHFMHSTSNGSQWGKLLA